MHFVIGLGMALGILYVLTMTTGGNKFFRVLAVGAVAIVVLAVVGLGWWSGGAFR